MTWEEIERVNKEIKTTELKGKQYAEVKERVVAYRKLYPQGVISTELTFTENYVLCEARVTNENNLVIATGHARELLNKAFAVENAETSALGRALGFLGLGISTSIATKEDMEQLDNQSGIFDEPIYNRIEMVKEFKSLFTNEEVAKILNHYHVVSIDNLTDAQMQGCINGKKHSTK